MGVISLVGPVASLFISLSIPHDAFACASKRKDVHRGRDWHHTTALSVIKVRKTARVGISVSGDRHGDRSPDFAFITEHPEALRFQSSARSSPPPWCRCP